MHGPISKKQEVSPMFNYLLILTITSVSWFLYFFVTRLIFKLGMHQRTQNVLFSNALALLGDTIFFFSLLTILSIPRIASFQMSFYWIALLNIVSVILFTSINGLFRAISLHKRGQLVSEVEI
jgi:hypothetical protein